MDEKDKKHTEDNLKRLRNENNEKHVVSVDELINGTPNAKVIMELCAKIQELAPSKGEFALMVSSVQESSDKPTSERIGYVMCGSDEAICYGLANAMLRQPNIRDIVFTAARLYSSAIEAKQSKEN